MKMDRLETIKIILKRHGIRFEIVEGRLIADNEYNLDGRYYSEKIDLTDHSIKNIKIWLGY
jgi:hypothetical protein